MLNRIWCWLGWHRYVNITQPYSLMPVYKCADCGYNPYTEK